MSEATQNEKIGDAGHPIVTIDQANDSIPGGALVGNRSVRETSAQAHHSANLPEMVIECMRTMLAALNGDTPAGDIVKMVAIQSRKWLRAEDVIIGRQDPATKTLTVCAAEGPRATASPESLLAPGMQALGRAALMHAPVMYTYDGHIATGIGEALPAVLAVPLANTDNSVCGGMLLFYASAPQLSAQETELAAMIGAQATAVMRNSERKSRDYTDAIAGERNRIARDLHDSVTQALYTISLITEALPSVWYSHPEEAMENVNTLHVLARGALAEMRTLLLELRPAEQADRNLSDLLRQLPDRMRFRSGVQVTTTVVGDTPLSKPVQTALYYIAQEALNNVDKHAHASRASVQLDFQTNGAVMLCVSDNGRGIDPTAIGHGQLGLGIMRERAAEIGAILSVDSRPDQGTRVIVEWRA